MIVLSIGTTHPWNTSGVGLDLQVGTELGVHVCSIVTAVAAQGTRGVTSIETIPTANVRKQLETGRTRRYRGDSGGGAHVA